MKLFDLESHKFADIFPMMDEFDAENLKKGLQEGYNKEFPIILYEGKILDGRNRYKASKELGLVPLFQEYSGKDPLGFVISGNLVRRHLTPSQRAVIALDVMPLLEEEAKKRQFNSFDTLAQKSANPSVSTGKSSKEAGKRFKVGSRYIEDVKKLKKEGKESVLEDLRSGTKTLQEVKKEERTVKLVKQRAELDKNILEKPTGLYDVIVIDPPWDYGTDESFNPDSFRGLTPYTTMSEEQIRAIKLPANENCVLWLWTTNRFLPESFNLLKQWGFELKSVLTWDKQQIGIGRWLRSQTEHCLLAIKGKPYYHNTTYSTLLAEKRTAHSVKPESFYIMVNSICAGRKLDYFARKKREGWDVYGDEIK